MADTNGSPVTRAELAAHIKGIDEQFHTIAADISEIKWSMHLVLENRKQRFLAWGPPLVSACIAATVSAVGYLIFK